MGITLRPTAGKRGQQAKGMKIKGRCRKHLKTPSERPITPFPQPGGRRNHSDVRDAVHLGYCQSIWQLNGCTLSSSLGQSGL